MKRLLEVLFGRRTTIIDVARFGARLEWSEVQSALRGREQEVLFRAVGQIVEFQRQQCQRAVEDKSNVPGGQTMFEAGGAAGAADVLAMLCELAEGRCRDAKLQAWFGERRAKAGESG